MQGRKLVALTSLLLGSAALTPVTAFAAPADLLAARHQPGFWFGRQRGYMAVGHSGTGQPRPRHTVGDYRAGNGDRSCVLQG